MAPLACTDAESYRASQLVAKGRESAALLHALLGQQLPPVASTTSTLHDHHHPMGLAEQILRCCDRALAALRRSAAAASTEDDDGGSSGRKRKLDRSSPGATPTHPASSKRIRAGGVGGNGARVEAPTMEDRFAWRKYGQKEIKNSKHPRLYFRCSYKDDHGCTATRQVQQSETDPAIYVITYFGQHTCHQVLDDGAVANVGEETQAPKVIRFGSSGRDPASSWPCSGDDAMERETSQERSLPEGEELIEELTPVPEMTGSIFSPAPDLETLLDDCFLSLELGENSFGTAKFNSFDELAGFLLDR